MIRPASLQRLNAAYRGRAREEAYLELAQEHFLDWIREQGLIDEITFKGGTSLRTFVFGLDGRFSHDLDFSTTDRGVGELVIEALDTGLTHQGATFMGSDVDHGAITASWVAVGGHGKLPTGGQESPHWRPTEFPIDGHETSPAE